MDVVRQRVRFIGYVLGMLAVLAMSRGQAANSLLIWPIDPVLDADQRATALWLENRGTQVANLQIRVFAWSQSDFADQYQNQRDVVGSPPVAKIDPGQKQLVRLTRTREAPPGQELAYRIIIDEIPMAQPLASEEASKASVAVQFQMRYSIPLFSYGAGLWSKENEARRNSAPKGGGVPELSWRKLTMGGRGYIEVRNQGPVHAQLSEVTFVQGERRQPLQGLLGYVLPGSAMRWPAPADLSSAAVMQARINGATQAQSIAVHAP